MVPSQISFVSEMICYFSVMLCLCVKFKVACLVCQSLPGQAPLYLVDDCCRMSDSTWRSLRSADVLTCMVLRTLSSYGNRTFAAAGASLVELSSGLATQSKDHLRFVQTTAEAAPFSTSMNTVLRDF